MSQYEEDAFKQLMNDNERLKAELKNVSQALADPCPDMKRTMVEVIEALKSSMEGAILRNVSLMDELAALRAQEPVTSVPQMTEQQRRGIFWDMTGKIATSSSTEYFAFCQGLHYNSTHQQPAPSEAKDSVHELYDAIDQAIQKEQP